MTGRRLASVLESQLKSAHDFARRTVAGLTDEEYFWEPVPGCWSVRRNQGANPPELPGLLSTGAVNANTRPWYCEHGWAWKGPNEAAWPDTGAAPPVTTIAWLMTHMSSCQITYHQDVFASGSLRFDDLVPTSAAQARALFEEGASALLDSLRSLSDEELLKPPASPKPISERQSWVGMNQEPLWHLFSGATAQHVVHHAAEIGRMRDLHRHSVGQPAGGA
jgi:hypothetical protein